MIYIDYLVIIDISVIDPLFHFFIILYFVRYCLGYTMALGLSNLLAHVHLVETFSRIFASSSIKQILNLRTSRASLNTSGILKIFFRV